MTVRERILRWLRVPAAPSAPDGDHAVRVFRASSRYYFVLVLRWLPKNTGAVIGLLVALRFASLAPTVLPPHIRVLGITISESTLLTLIGLVEAGAVVAFVVQAAATLALTRLEFEQRWYIVTDRSLRIREGLVRLREQTITFANVQHVSIKQGPLSRLLGIADVQVRTAGGKGGTGEDGNTQSDLHVAHFHGISNADEVRDTIRERLRLHRDAGLGDPDDVGSSASALDLHGAAQQLAAEARALRAELLKV